MKNLKNLIIIVGILIVVILTALIVLPKKEIQISNTIGEIKNENSITGNLVEEVQEEAEPLNEAELERIPYNEDIEPLTDALYYFVIKNCMQQYLDVLNTENSSYYGYDENENYVNLL